jgi:hypothetical protein
MGEELFIQSPPRIKRETLSLPPIRDILVIRCSVRPLIRDTIKDLKQNGIPYYVYDLVHREEAKVVFTRFPFKKNTVDALHTVHIPAYRRMLRDKSRQKFLRNLRELAAGKVLILLDERSNINIENTAEPLSIACFLKEELMSM